jgi:hypothetical protein
VTVRCREYIFSNLEFISRCEFWCFDRISLFTKLAPTRLKVWSRTAVFPLFLCRAIRVVLLQLTHKADMCERVLPNPIFCRKRIVGVSWNWIHKCRCGWMMMDRKYILVIYSKLSRYWSLLFIIQIEVQ